MSDSAPQTPVAAPAVTPTLPAEAPMPLPSVPPSRWQKAQLAAEAARAAAMAKAPPPAPVSEPPSAAAPAAAPVAAAVPAAEPTKAAPAAEPAAPPNTPLEMSWEAVKAGEKRLQSERQRIKAEMETLQKQRGEVEKAGGLEGQLRKDPLTVLRSMGWDNETLARHLLASAKATAEGAAPAAPALPAETAPARGLSVEEVARIERIESYLLGQQYQAAISKYELLAAEPDSMDRVSAKINRHYELTGEGLTPDKAAAIVEAELVAQWKTRISDPRLRSALGLPEVSAAPAPKPPAAPAPAADDDDLSSLTNNLSVAAPSAGGRLTQLERLERAMKAIKTASA